MYPMIYSAFLICTCRLPQPNNQSHRAYSLAPVASCRFCHSVLIAMIRPSFLKTGRNFLFSSLPVCHSFPAAVLTVLTAFFAVVLLLACGTSCGLTAACAPSCVPSCAVSVVLVALSRRWDLYGVMSFHALPADWKNGVDFSRSSSACAKGRLCTLLNSRITVLARPLMRTGTDSPAQLALFALRTAARLVSSVACALHDGQITSLPTDSNCLPQ